MDVETPASPGARASIGKRGRATQLAHAAMVAVGVPVAALALSSLFGGGTALLTALAMCVIGGLVVPPLLLASLLLGVERRVPGRGARITKDHLVLGEPAEPIDRRELTGGMLVHGHEGPSVELSLRQGGLVRLQVEREEEGFSLLRALGLAGPTRAVTHELGGGRPALRAGRALVFATLLSVVFGAGLGLVQNLLRLDSFAVLAGGTSTMFLLLTWFAMAQGAPARIVVGKDGVELVGTTRRFIPFRRIASVAATPDGVFLFTTGGAFGKRILLTKERGPRSDALIEELQKALDDSERARGLADPERLALLDRGERSLRAWREDLQRLATSSAGYRQAGIERDDLIDAACDVRVAKARRVAAALALSHTGDAAAIERVRVAVDGLAEQELRSLMSDALAGELEEAALERAALEEAAAEEVDGQSGAMADRSAATGGSGGEP